MTLYSIIDSDDGHILGSYNIKADIDEIDKILKAVITIYGSNRKVVHFLTALEMNDIKYKQIEIKGGVF